MKTTNLIYLALCLTILLPLGAVAQQKDSLRNDEIKTIFKKQKGSRGGYATLTAGYTQIGGQDGFCYGFNAACMIGHSLGIGISGSGFSNEYFLDHPSGSNYRSLQGGYGGIFIEPVVFPKFPVHVSFPVTIGLGAVAQLDAYYWGNFEYEYYYEDADLFFVAEPGIDIELNLVRHVRLGVGAKYRFTTATQLEGMAGDALNGFSVNLGLKFGKF